MRKTRTGADAVAGCYTCHGDDAHWFSRNAVGVAARHHDATGHPTWATQSVYIFYGESGPLGKNTPCAQSGESS